MQTRITATSTPTLKPNPITSLPRSTHMQPAVRMQAQQASKREAGAHLHPAQASPATATCAARAGGVAPRIFIVSTAAAFMLSVAAPQAGVALGLEGLPLPGLDSIQAPEGFKDYANSERAKLDGVDKNFNDSEMLKELLARSEANKEKNQKSVLNKYCFRQAEIGVGDCGGLRFIPGMTNNGKQRTPDWLAKLLGVEPQPEQPAGALTLEQLLGERPE